MSGLKVFYNFPLYFIKKWPIKVFKSIEMPFYAVAKGRTTGIFMTWADCEAQVKGFSGAKYKKFDTIVGAQDFVTSIQGVTSSTSNTSYIQKEPLNKSNNLKRSYSTSSYNAEKTSKKSSKKTAKQKVSTYEDENSEDSNSDCDLDSILNKQLDDIEKRLAESEKNMDKRLKGNSSVSTKKTILIDSPQNKKKRFSGKMEFEEDRDGYVHVYTDGACSANGRSGAKAGYGVYWGEDHSLNTSEPVSGRATNNCGEIQAATCAIKLALKNGVTKLAINTDSQFLINSVTKWMPGWKSKGWKLKSGEPVKNETDFKELDSYQKKLDIKWNYVEAHRGVHGNEMADQLAKAGASLYNKK